MFLPKNGIPSPSPPSPQLRAHKPKVVKRSADLQRFDWVDLRARENLLQVTLGCALCGSLGENPLLPKKLQSKDLTKYLLVLSRKWGNEPGDSLNGNQIGDGL